MKTSIKMIRTFFSDEDGVTAIEYGLLASLIAVMVIAGATLIGTQLDATFLGIGAEINPPAGS